MLFTCIKSWFFRNHLANFHQISHWSFCWNVIDSLFKWSCSIDCQAHIFFFKTKNCSMMIFSLVAMIGLEKCCITSACLQWLCHSGERIVTRGPLVYIIYTFLFGYKRLGVVGCGERCILCHRGIQLILAYSWARLAILVAGKGRGGMFLFLLFLYFHSCSSFFPVPLFYLHIYLFCLFSPFLRETTQMTHKGWHVVKPKHHPPHSTLPSLNHFYIGNCAVMNLVIPKKNMLYPNKTV